MISSLKIIPFTPIAQNYLPHLWKKVYEKNLEFPRIDPDSCYMWSHQGLGDHLICNAIYREFAKKYKHLYLFVKEHNYPSVKAMLDDLGNVYYIIGDDNPMGIPQMFIAENPLYNYYFLGHHNMRGGMSFDQSFYNQVQMGFSKKYSKFKIGNRDHRSELALFDLLNLKKGEYIFVHDKNQFDDSKFGNEKIVKPPLSGFPIFNWLYIIENAKSIHCVDSSFLNLIDCYLNLSGPPKFFYDGRNNNPPKINESWIIL